MPEFETIEYETLRPIIISGNCLDITLYKLQKEFDVLNHNFTKLWNQASNNIDILIESTTNDFKNEKEVWEHLNNVYALLMGKLDVLSEITQAIEIDGSSELEIIYKD